MEPTMDRKRDVAFPAASAASASNDIHDCSSTINVTPQCTELSLEYPLQKSSTTDCMYLSKCSNSHPPVWLAPTANSEALQAQCKLGRSSLRETKTNMSSSSVQSKRARLNESIGNEIESGSSNSTLLNAKATLFTGDGGEGARRR